MSPPPNADPRTIVSGFLTANALVDVHHNSARDFLTPDAKNRWSDTTVTVVSSEQISNFQHGSVTVHGTKLGTVSASGVYTPVLQGNGTSGTGFEVPFGMKKVRNQWRVDTLASGLILTSDAFQRIYQQRTVYFYDLMEQHLIPDPRYTALSDSLLANWLVGQLASAPRPELQNAMSSELPAQTDPRRISVILGSTGHHRGARRQPTRPRHPRPAGGPARAHPGPGDARFGHVDPRRRAPGRHLLGRQHPLHRVRVRVGEPARAGTGPVLHPQPCRRRCRRQAPAGRTRLRSGRADLGRHRHAAGPGP